jgi:hypothetical protein
VGQVACMDEVRGVDRVSGGRPEGQNLVVDGRITL